MYFRLSLILKDTNKIRFGDNNSGEDLTFIITINCRGKKVLGKQQSTVETQKYLVYLSILSTITLVFASSPSCNILLLLLHDD